MDRTPDTLEMIDLAAGDVLALDDVAGARIIASCGSAWITEEGEIEDFVIRAGESRTVMRDGRTLVQAMQPLCLSIVH